MEGTADGCSPLAFEGPGHMWGRQWCGSLSARPGKPCREAHPGETNHNCVVPACEMFKNLLYLLLKCVKRHLTFDGRTFKEQPAMQTSKLNCALYTPQQGDAQYASNKYHQVCGVGMQVRLVYTAEVCCHAQMSSHLLEPHHCY